MTIADGLWTDEFEAQSLPVFSENRFQFSSVVRQSTGSPHPAVFIPTSVNIFFTASAPTRSIMSAMPGPQNSNPENPPSLAYRSAT
jgi:hypothetical protein